MLTDMGYSAKPSLVQMGELFMGAAIRLDSPVGMNEIPGAVCDAMFYLPLSLESDNHSDMAWMSMCLSVMYLVGVRDGMKAEKEENHAE